MITDPLPTLFPDELGEVPSQQPEEIEDEYILSLKDGVDDDSLLEPTGKSNFSITSYGADYPVDTLVKRLKDSAFFVPEFQRRFVWSQRHASRFIESLLMGLPVPGIFLYKETESGRHLVVDGQQRLRTLQYFYNGVFGERAFKLIGVREEWEGKTYDTLGPTEQLRLDDSIVHATIFQQDEPKDNRKSLYFVFERINSGGIRLSPQEIRNCINDGNFTKIVRNLNKDSNWRSIFGEKLNNRLKDQELVLRFLAMYYRGEDYSRPMRDFLNDFASDMDSAPIATAAEFESAFQNTIKLCFEALGKAAFRPSRPFNAAVYEAVMIGVASRLKNSSVTPTAEKLKQAYERLLTDKDFLRATVRATADEESVKTRQQLAINAFKII